MFNINANTGQTHICLKNVHISILKIKSMGLYDYIKNQRQIHTSAVLGRTS